MEIAAVSLGETKLVESSAKLRGYSPKAMPHQEPKQAPGVHEAYGIHSFSKPARFAPALRVHGGLSEAEASSLGQAAQPRLDFSVNINPYGPAVAVRRAIREAVRKAALECYPQASAAHVREALARACGWKPEGVVLGHGAAELLWGLARTLIRPRTRVLVITPAFAEFSAAAQRQGAQIQRWRLRAADHFALHLDALDACLAKTRPAVVALETPNNPTGRGTPLRSLLPLFAAHPRIHFIVDQSFLPLSEQHADLSLAPPQNATWVRSLTKTHALPGLRVGYLLTEGPLARRLEADRPPWSTSAPAQAAALATCDQETFVQDSRRRLLRGAAQMRADLAQLGLFAEPSSTCFLLVPVRDAFGLRTRLLQRGILVRHCASFGLPGCLRFAVRPARERQRLYTALQTELRP